MIMRSNPKDRWYPGKVVDENFPRVARLGRAMLGCARLEFAPEPRLVLPLRCLFEKLR